MVASESLFQSFLQQLEAESDRGGAILVASVIEELLGILLRSTLVDDPESDRLLTHGNGFLSSLDRRARLAFALGLITRGELKDCRYIERVRNEYAHRIVASFARSAQLQRAVRNHSKRDPASISSRVGEDFANEEFLAEVKIIGMALAHSLLTRVAANDSRRTELMEPRAKQ